MTAHPDLTPEQRFIERRRMLVRVIAAAWVALATAWAYMLIVVLR